MPFRSKKTTRCSTFSQLVANHLQSRKRSGALVVETGFPTSIVDLYVRNRRRLRKISDKKQSSSDSSNPLIESSNPSSVSSNHRESDEIVEEGVVDVDVSSSLSDIEETGVEIAYLNRVLVTGLKVLLMAVLALGTKRFTVGITVAAFLLFFVEYLGRSRLSTPSCDRGKLLQSRFHRAKITSSFESNSTPAVCNEALKIEEHKEVADSVAREILVEIKHKKSLSAKMQSKMLKLLPKKSRKSKNSCLDSKDKIVFGFKEERTFEKHNDPKFSNECLDSNGASKKDDKFIQEEKSLNLSRINLSNESDQDDKEMQSNSGFLVFCLVVLVGLIGGRILGLVLAVSWCLTLKMTQWRHVKLVIL